MFILTASDEWKDISEKILSCNIIVINTMTSKMKLARFSDNSENTEYRLQKSHLAFLSKEIPSSAVRLLFNVPSFPWLSYMGCPGCEGSEAAAKDVPNLSWLSVHSMIVHNHSQVSLSSRSIMQQSECSSGTFNVLYPPIKRSVI